MSSMARTAPSAIRTPSSSPAVSAALSGRHRLVHHGERPGRVEVVVHRVGELGRQVGRLDGADHARPRAARSPRSAGRPWPTRAAPPRSSRCASGSAGWPGSSAVRPGVRRGAITSSRSITLPSDLLILVRAQVEQRVVHPEAGEAEAGRPGLGDLVLVVRKGQVEAAAVDVELLAEVAAGTSRSTRCASRAGRGPTARPSRRRPARRAWRPSRARSRAGRAWPAPAPSGGGLHVVRLLAGERAVAGDRSARRSRRRRSRPRPGRRDRRRSTSRSARASRGCARWRAARRSGAAH